MSQMSPTGTPTSSWENRQRQSTLSLHVLPDQVHSPTQALGLSGRDASESDLNVRGRDELTPVCPPSGCPSSHGLLWVKAQAAQLPDTPVPTEVKEAEMDELFTFIGEKKQIYVITIVDRGSRCYLAVQIVWQRTQAAIQEMVIRLPRRSAITFDAYDRLWNHLGVYKVSQGKADTYSVEAGNAKLHHYLARLARCSRCFSCCPEALKAALKLFMYCFNRRQLHKQLFPNYQAHVYKFI